MLPARYRMTRSTEFGATVKRGFRVAQPDLVLHFGRDDADPTGPRIGLVVNKAVGGAVVRHRVSRRIRHVAATMLDDFHPTERVVIRALPGSRAADSATLEKQIRAGVRRRRQSDKSSR